MKMARILIVDDEEMSTASLKAGLEWHAHVVTACRDGAKGLAILSRGTVDLVIIDILMSGEDGLGLISSARRSSIRIPIIALAAGPLSLSFDDPGYDFQKVARKLGADATLCKPVQPGELQQLVRMFLGTAKANLRQ